ncbi:hypothetical protein [Nocardia asteroides]|uniref:hypothetical protein n=1 Tax=Nocardia asteroides TaxID=1824 RepID=UPI001E2DD7BF|nr:hypothetical protein [Nocardia asteroides]UGT58919.1 hypothetical protein LTT85_33065 [Nocardia asteroides]
MDTTDPSTAEVYEESAETPVAGGRWYVVDDETVLYQRPGATEHEPSTIRAATLRGSSTWRRTDTAPA